MTLQDLTDTQLERLYQRVLRKIHCDWPGVTADLSDTGEITLTKDPLGEFVRFKIVG